MYRIFCMHKFRTMVEEAESKSGPIWDAAACLQVTRVGRFLRKLALDELPLLWNVLKGDMSLVGPSAERPEFVEKLERENSLYSERFLVKPGITGWAQVNYAYGDSIQDTVERLSYDLFYIKNMSLQMDMVVLLRTLNILLVGGRKTSGRF